MKTATFLKILVSYFIRNENNEEMGRFSVYRIYKEPPHSILRKDMGPSH